MLPRMVLVVLTTLVAINVSALSPPQYTLQRQLAHSIGNNPAVEVSEVYEQGTGYAIDVTCSSRDVAEGLSFILIRQYNFGGIEVTVRVLDELGEPVEVDESAGGGDPKEVTKGHFHNALRHNRLFVSFVDPFWLTSFNVEIAAEVIQFWNDNIGNPHGQDNSIAAEVFGKVCRPEFFDGTVTVGFSTADKGAEAGHREGFIQVAAHGPGKLDSFWTTEVWIQSLGADQVQMWFNPSGGGERRAVTVAMNGGAVFYLEDVVAELFQTEGMGSIHYLADSGVLVTSRTWTPARDGGTYGQIIPGIPIDAPLTSTDAGGAPLRHVVNQRPGFRVNLGLVNITGEAATAQFGIYTAEGELAPGTSLRTVELGPWGMVQISNILRTMQPGEWQGLTVGARVTSASGRIMAYLCEIDDTTNDSSYQEGRIR